MCLTIPSRIVSIKNENIIVDELGKEKKVTGSLVKARVGDYVLLQNNFIIRKVDEKSAKEIINLIKGQ